MLIPTTRLSSIGWFIADWVIYIVYITAVTELRPTADGVVMAFVSLLGYAAIMWCFNKLNGSNYFYIMKKPDTASILDYMGDWPWYIATGTVASLFIFYLLYLPFVIFR